jgi:hypothetical protein
MNPYSEVRHRIKSGDVIAVSHNSLKSFYDLQVMGVRFFQASKYAHVGLAWRVGGRLFMLEAVTPFVRMVPLSHFAEEGFDVICLTTRMSAAELEAALEQVGRVGYSKWQAILGFFKRLKLGADRLTQCCEFVIVNRAISGVDLGDTATPSAVVDAALALPGSALHSVKGL